MFANFKLGKHEPKLDARTFKLAKYITAMPKAPAKCDWGTEVIDWGMMKNDTVGDCTCASAGHLIELWSSLTTAAGRQVSDADVIAAYSAITGYDPATGANDNGANLLDVLNYWRKTGIGGDKITAFASVNLRNPDEVKFAIWAFGGLYAGVGLPLSAQTQTIWRVSHSEKGRPYSWGGHAIPIVAYDKTMFEVITWGRRLEATHGFMTKYGDEAYAIISNDWLNKGRCPAGFDLAALQADLQKLT